ncbi:MAG: oligosaccharide flippase family protein, partial [Solobacterium sp.]|nr:oligosaccharide flippase family protein [Solobacterium sp.]
MNDEKKQLKYGALISYLAIFINTATALIYLPWMARKLGQSDYALYTLAFSFVNFFLLDFGLSAAVSRFAAKYRAEHDEESTNRLVGTVTKMYLALDVLLAAVFFVVYFFIDLIYKGLTPAEIAAF